MIAVIADDFTGAAELAGIGLRYGLKVELCTTVIKSTEADMIVLCTDSRSMSKEEAVRITGRVVEEIMAWQPSLIYKKIDSVFRGHVVEELKIQMQKMGKYRAIVSGANPSLGRIIRDGVYYVNGQPVSETGFANDPEFPITHSSVLKMLHDGDCIVAKPAEELLAEGILVAETVTAEDLAAWAGKADDRSVVAGAGDFFAAILDKKYTVQPQPQPGLQLPHLYVCGTAFGKRNEFIRRAAQKGDYVAYLSFSMMQTGMPDEKWTEGVNKILEEHGRAIIAIDPEERKLLPGVAALSLRITMAKAVAEVAGSTGVTDIFIEGGSTASAVLDELKIHELIPVSEWQRGVVRMKAKAQNIYIMVKPGSYQLPDQISALYS